MTATLVRPAVELDAAARAVTDLLVALGHDPATEDLAETPQRVARAYAELLAPRPFDPTTFPNDEGYDQLVLAKAIPFSSLCQHHLLPFVGVAHVGYLPADRILGLSKPPGWSSCSPAASSSRNGSPPRSPTGSRPSWPPRASESCWRPSTCA